MPSLRTLSIDHVFEDELLPTCLTGPLLVALHVRGNWGFKKLAIGLVSDPSLSISEDIGGADETKLPI